MKVRPSPPSMVLLLMLAACGAVPGADHRSTTTAVSPIETPLATPDAEVKRPPPSSMPKGLAPVSSLPPSPVPDGEAQEVGDIPSGLVLQVIEDAARRTNIEPASVEVIAVENRSWSDGSLGCPELGMFYPQVITPGFRIQLNADRQRLDYRLDTTGYFKLCRDRTGLEIPVPDPQWIPPPADSAINPPTS